MLSQEEEHLLLPMETLSELLLKLLAVSQKKVY